MVPRCEAANGSGGFAALQAANLRSDGVLQCDQLSPKGVEALRAELDLFWDKALDAYKLIADEEGNG